LDDARAAGQHETVAWDRIRSSYDTVAAAYARRFDDELTDKPRDRVLLEQFAATVADPIVEIGCGPGQVGAFLCARGRRVTGLDLSHQMTKIASRVLDAAITADMRALPLRQGTVGGVLAFYSIIHVQRPELIGVLEEFRRVLRPGGRVLLSAHEGKGDVAIASFLDHDVPLAATLFGLDELVEAGEAGGLEIVRAERRPPYPSEAQTFRLYVEARRR